MHHHKFKVVSKRSVEVVLQGESRSDKQGLEQIEMLTELTSMSI